MRIQVEELGPNRLREYEEFVLAEPVSLIYASRVFRDFLVQAIGGEASVLIALDADQQICGGLPFMCRDVPGFGSVINSLPWYGSHGGCQVSGETAGAAREALLSAFRDCLGEKVLSATVVLSHAEEEARGEYERILQPAATDYRIGQMTELPPDCEMIEEQLEGTFLQKTRNLVRKALKQGFEVSYPDDEESWQFLFGTHVENMQAIGGRPKPWEHFEALRTCVPKAHRQLLLALDHGVPVAALLLLYFNKTVEYLTPVIRQEHRQRQPLSFLIWHGMREAVLRGCNWWNWGGTWTSQDSLHHFKAGWGAIDRPYSYLIVATDEGREILTSSREQLTELFPYYYTFPFHLLSSR